MRSLCAPIAPLKSCASPHHSLCPSRVSLILIPHSSNHSSLTPASALSLSPTHSLYLPLCLSVLFSLRAMSAELLPFAPSNVDATVQLSSTHRAEPEPIPNSITKDAAFTPLALTPPAFIPPVKQFPAASAKSLLLQLQPHSTRAEAALHRDHCSENGLPFLRQGLLWSTSAAAARAKTVEVSLLSQPSSQGKLFSLTKLCLGLGLLHSGGA